MVDAVGRGHGAVAEEKGERPAIDLGAEIAMRAERLEFGAEEERRSGPAVIERLFSEAVAGEREAAFLPVPEGEGEHADAALDRRGEPPRFDGGEDHFGVRAAAEPVSRAGKLGAQLGEVIDLTVENDDVATARGAHRLMPGGREIEDREPPETQRQPAFRVGPHPGVVRPAMGERGGHARDLILHFGSGPRAIFPVSGKAAHLS